MLEKKIRSFQGRRSRVLGHEDTFKSAVLVPLIHKSDDIYILFEKRSANLNRQPGEICFPGGELEPGDKGARATAIRETCEELGLLPEDIEIIAALDVMVHPFSSIIVPYLAFIRETSLLKPNPAEVDRLLYVPLDYLLSTEPQVHDITMQAVMKDDFPFDLIPYGRNYPFRGGVYRQYFYMWEGEVIWGLTSRILQHFVELLKA